ncbi:hypothetical protein FALBO_15348 [Fusarium albosuccineum]|uniref:GIY-YIG domain-containing protein n=1 Tax=Fusarium albosuccineum TaxID=1237068 RepID=A0A8H4P4A2_9HYPO|nr:hypothetical protein FALBO_15348 [Fusarium albosuccineum]
MTDLLLREFPKLPPGAQTPQAIVLRCDYAYDDNAAHVPSKLRHHIPESMKKGGKLQLYKNEEGFLYQKHPQGEWGMALFIRDGFQLHIILPMSDVIIGKDFRPLADKFRDQYPAITSSNSSIILQSGRTKLESFIRTFWNAIRQDSTTLKRLNMTAEKYAELFSDANFQANLSGILDGMVPQARRIFRDGNFSLQDILSLPEANEHQSPSGQTIYLRVYTNLKMTNNFGIYVGQTHRALHKRHTEHEAAIEAGWEMQHYRIARQTQSENRHTFTLCFWDDTATARQSGGFLDMAEQTMFVILRSYHGWVASCDPNMNHGSSPRDMANSSHGAYVLSIARQARALTGWQHSWGLQARGCNLSSPLFSFNTHSPMNCYRMQAIDPAVRTFTTYRKPCTIRQLTHSYFTTLSYCNGDGNRVALYFSIKENCFQGFVPKSGYIVFEIMDDHKPHDNPWLGCPSVGPFENFDQASSLGIRFEWFDETRHEWLTALIGKSHMFRHMSTAGIEGLLSSWRQALTIIQVLEGITWTGPLNGLENGLSFGACRVMELKVDHLQQTCQWVGRVRKQCPAPVRASWENNVRLMVDQFARGATIIRLEPPPIDDQFWRPTDYDVGRMRMMTHVRMGRPCTFTPPSISQQQAWGNNPPLLRYTGSNNEVGWSVYPTGPHRKLAFHRAISLEKLSTPIHIREPFEGKSGFQTEEDEPVEVGDVATAAELEEDE